MSWILKYFGFKALKALFLKFVVSTWTRPGIHKLGKLVQKYADDPTTNADENFVIAFEKFGNYLIEKKLGKL